MSLCVHVFWNHLSSEDPEVPQKGQTVSLVVQHPLLHRYSRFHGVNALGDDSRNIWIFGLASEFSLLFICKFALFPVSDHFRFFSFHKTTARFEYFVIEFGSPKESVYSGEEVKVFWRTRRGFRKNLRKKKSIFLYTTGHDIFFAFSGFGSRVIEHPHWLIPFFLAWFRSICVWLDLHSIFGEGHFYWSEEIKEKCALLKMTILFCNLDSNSPIFKKFKN